ncbi:ead/Ea22-like family protein [Robbsia andropogonis]|uniref:ead/Ea22-like family protein n=1 Tax=Robbsia andropogonis TaxID=28092 RepID=UPI00209F4E18|nr:ead/Ea22-like family protein [Robbsia andropogonis]MCP1116998.1 ead/Ea22-like family protein [Robbsia andropogonis]MCP1126323.1 ead/Ea22-like family protein [Robbsia andropogonis]
MTDKYEALRKAAEACGKERWNSNGDFVYCAHLSIARCSGDLYHPSGTPVAAHEQARYIAVANPSTILELLDELEALKEDAKRYRWLRDQDENSLYFIACGDTGTWGECGHSSVYGKYADSVIDAKLEQKQ